MFVVVSVLGLFSLQILLRFVSISAVCLRHLASYADGQFLFPWWIITPFTSVRQVSRILYSFATAFRRSAKKAALSAQQPAPLTPDSDLFTFTVSLEIKEDDGKGTFRWDEHCAIMHSNTWNIKTNAF